LKKKYGEEKHLKNTKKIRKKLGKRGGESLEMDHIHNPKVWTILI
jgi:hypothetical protein